jgi:threonine/homoserine/homoserine lactone efflux protein
VPDSWSLLGFVAAALVLLVTPGPGVLYVVARSVEQGRRAGLVSVLGLSAGALVHVGAAAAGISAILLASATAFGLVKALGAAYLIYLGIRTLLGRRSAANVEVSTSRTLHRLFRDGVLVSVLNPKIALFFLAFLPQFVDPHGAPVPQQIVVLGLVYVSLALVTDSGYALLASRLRGWLGTRGLHGPLPRYLCGSVYLGLGISTALTGRRP